MVSTRSKKYDYAKLSNATSGSDDENTDLNTSPVRASSQSGTPSKSKTRKNKRVDVKAAAPPAPRATAATDDDDTSDDNAQTRPTHFTRKASSVAATATGGGDGSGPSVVDRDRHDIFNVVALLPLVFLTLANYDWTVVWASANPEAAWTDQYFWEYWVATMIYFFVDTVWVWKVPTCVKSPGVIIKHHIVALLYLVAPVLFPEFRWAMGACLSVEINTWFLIMRRVVYLRRERVPSAVVEFMNAAFYSSWIAIRCVLFPLIMAIYLRKCVEALEETGTLMHWPIIFVPVHGIFCALNLKWSYDLFTPLIVGWFKSDGSKAAQKVGDGL
eukprot:CAMPEP_0181032224 /NCGR_PEP_ID=MMETSP1070-20121207/6632_1 /TAXON_ID=265543 /ORGANISM="Minutocellus polymorphus, Strain NH13" /LENGTH=328 /DNA_ID=CAMNT_0023109615 /DNA_START=117 /DNA_END=1103 /DNA_ORIENTATION=-